MGHSPISMAIQLFLLLEPHFISKTLTLAYPGRFCKSAEFLKDSLLKSTSTSKDVFKLIELQPASVSQYCVINIVSTSGINRWLQEKSSKRPYRALKLIQASCSLSLKFLWSVLFKESFSLSLYNFVTTSIIQASKIWVWFLKRKKRKNAKVRTDGRRSIFTVVCGMLWSCRKKSVL